jgi:hypothetical protein
MMGEGTNNKIIDTKNIPKILATTYPVIERSAKLPIYEGRLLQDVCRGVILEPIRKYFRCGN